MARLYVPSYIRANCPHPLSYFSANSIDSSAYISSYESSHLLSYFSADSFVTSAYNTSYERSIPPRNNKCSFSSWNCLSCVFCRDNYHRRS